MQPEPSNGCILKPDGYSGPADIPSLACLAQVVVSVINVAFAFLGFVTLVFLLFGAIKFIVSRGDQKALQAAKNTITYAIIGAVLVVLSFVIVNIVFGFLGMPTILNQFSFYQNTP